MAGVEEATGLMMSAWKAVKTFSTSCCSGRKEKGPKNIGPSHLNSSSAETAAAVCSKCGHKQYLAATGIGNSIRHTTDSSMNHIFVGGNFVINYQAGKMDTEGYLCSACSGLQPPVPKNEKAELQVDHEKIQPDLHDLNSVEPERGPDLTEKKGGMQLTMLDFYGPSKKQTRVTSV